jgi:uncharacterized protein (TIGR03118 family)
VALSKPGTGVEIDSGGQEMKHTISRLVLAGILIFAAKTTIAQYQQKNLVADEKGHAIRTDPHLINGWGLAFFPHGPFWVVDEGTGVSTVYGPHGKPIPLVVTIPAAPSQPFGPQGTPTGLVANTTSGFVISQNGKSGPARFIFDSEDGTISGWNPDVDPDYAVIVIDYSTSKPNRRFSGSYYGLAIGENSRGQTVIYAADGGTSATTDNNEIDMFNDEFEYLGSFSDPHIPSDMGVYGIQNIDGRLYVSFAGFEQYQGGIIDVFDTDGKLLRRFAANSSEGPLQAPWGFALAPADFGVFSNALLIGNVQGGRINAFNPNTGAFLGHLQNIHGDPIEIEGLWSLAFGTDKHANGKTNELFFTAGPTFPPNTAEYSNGLFGVIRDRGDDDDSDGPSDY